MSPYRAAPDPAEGARAQPLDGCATEFAGVLFAKSASTGDLPVPPATAAHLAESAASKTAKRPNLKRNVGIGTFATMVGLGIAVVAVPGVASAETPAPSSPKSSVTADRATNTSEGRAPTRNRQDRTESTAGSDRSDRPTKRTRRVSLAMSGVASNRTLPEVPDHPGQNVALPAPLVPVSRRTAAPTINPDDEQRDVVVEAEALSVARPSRAATDTDPTATNGTALVLQRNTSASTTLTLPTFTSLVIRAKGDQYRGAPQMKVSVNGKVVSTVSVAATSWTDYRVPFGGPAGNYTVSIAFTNDRYSRRYGDRNLRLNTVTAVSAVVDPQPPTPPSTGTPGFFERADWLWAPIGANPALATDSATWVEYLAAPDKLRIANLYDYSVALVSAADITPDTPRYDVTLTKPWGSDPFGSATVPIPAGTKIPPGSDGHLAVLDPVTGLAYGIWQAKYNTSTNTWSGSWGGMTDLHGDGIDGSGSATAAAIARYAGVVTAAEFSAALAANTGIDHALAFSTDLAGPGFVYPAKKSDGQNWAGVALPIPEGYRIQLDPAIDVDAVPGMTAGERVIAKTLQTHGAYVVDQGAARMAFAFELVDDATPASPGSVWVDAGFAWDYYDMNGIPWNQLRVLAPAAVSV